MIADLTANLTKEEFENAVDELELLVKVQFTGGRCKAETLELIDALKRIVERRRGELTLS